MKKDIFFFCLFLRVFNMSSVSFKCPTPAIWRSLAPLSALGLRFVKPVAQKSNGDCFCSVLDLCLLGKKKKGKEKPASVCRRPVELLTPFLDFLQHCVGLHGLNCYFSPFLFWHIFHYRLSVFKKSRRKVKEDGRQKIRGLSKSNMLLWSRALDSVFQSLSLVYIYIFLLFRLYDAQMMDRHCVNKMSMIVLLQPMDCQRAVSVHRGV